MQLLVSVSNEIEAHAALVGGAIIIDAKDPSAGALGAVSIDEFRRIHTIVGGIRPVSAALGDAADAVAIAHAAREYANAGAAFVKADLAAIEDDAHLQSLIEAAVRGTGNTECGVVAVTYADRGYPPDVLQSFIRVAARAGAAGVLIDTADKDGPGLRALMATDALVSWVTQGHGAGLIVSAAGKLTIDDLAWVRDCGVDIAGVRGAACERGRTSRISSENVRQLRAAASAVYVPPAAPDAVAPDNAARTASN